ncbi:MAG TPA: glycoside hydrolase family 2 TIM barrel-domain containing protein [Acidobacteriaceae bacterium]|nr:glycoside hydrolase family 2 TIM barrel-domain containing protein [Acidobacteriaceae bacterium]
MLTTRRDFLKSSALLGGASGVSFAVSPAVAHALASDPAQAAIAQSFETGWEFARTSLGGPWEAWNLDGIPWSAQQLPHCFNAYDACDPDHPAYRGQGWYRARLNPANPIPQGRTLIHFGGAGQRTMLYAGDHLIGGNVGGYNEFVLDVTGGPGDADGQMRLSVLCDNSRDLETIPSDISDFNLYGGLYRHVNLLYVPAVSLEMVHILPRVTPGQPATCRVSVQLYNPANLTGPAEISIEVTGPDGSPVFHQSRQVPIWQGTRECAQFTVRDPRLWSPSSPSLYTCRLALRGEHGEQTVSQRFGIRHFEFLDHGPFLLNGEKLFLRGTQRHEDHAGYAAAIPDDITRQEFGMIREMGANFIRLAHYQQSQLVLDLCDELGLIVWEELPWCRSGAGDEAMRGNARDLLRTMIRQHFNHPSIVFWSLGNEEDWPNIDPGDGRETVRSLMQQLQRIAHEEDSSRLTAFRRCKTATDVTDVYSPSIWEGWYSGRYQDYQKVLEGYRGKIRHLLHLEWGADCQARRHAEEPTGEEFPPFVPAGEQDSPAALPLVKHGDWSETYACDLFDWYLKTQETLPWFAGSAQWIFKDFSTPDRPENPIPRVNQKGLTERDLTKKEGYYVFQSYWATKPMVHIYGHSWPVRWGRPEESRLVRVYSNCESAELFLNGKSLGVKTRNSQDFPCAGLRWKPSFLPGKNMLRAVGRRDGTLVEDEVQFLYETRAWGKPASLMLTRKADFAGNAVVEATLVDANGVICLDARNRLRFSLAGDGKLNDNLGTVTGSRVVELCNGRAEISLLPGAQPSVVAVSCDGVPDAFLRIS